MIVYIVSCSADDFVSVKRSLGDASYVATDHAEEHLEREPGILPLIGIAKEAQWTPARRSR